jgi:hypothetical protein
MVGAAGSGRGRRRLALTVACHSRVWQLTGVRVFRATVVGFQWGLLLRDHSGEGNFIRLTLISGGWQRSPAMVRRLDRCLVTVRAASGEDSAPRTCDVASSNSLLASQPINVSERQRKTQIWWLPRVRRVLDLWPKIHTIGGAIYRGF